MKCSICKRNEAIIHIHEYSKNNVKKLYLCLDCAMKKGFSAGQDGNFEELLSDFVRSLLVNKNLQGNMNLYENDNTFALICPVCHTSITDFSIELQFGCPKCYGIFQKFIDLILYKHNNSLTYKGKLPKDLLIMKKDKSHLRKLKSELKRSVVLEDYQTAAQIRDEIKELKRKINIRIKNIAKK